MQINNRLLDDLTRVTNSALGTMTGVKGEVDSLIRQQFEKILMGMDLVTREEYDIVHDVATRAAERIEELESRLSALEEKLATTEQQTKSKPASKSAAKKTASAKTEPNTES